MPKCCLKTLLFNMSIEAAEDGTLTFVHPEQPGAYADRLPTVPPVLPKAKVGAAKTLSNGLACAGASFRCPRGTLLVLWVGHIKGTQARRRPGQEPP